MARLSLSPTDVAFSATTRPVIECDLKLGGAGSPFVSMGVTLAVYDRDIYARSAAGAKEQAQAQSTSSSQAWPGFTSDSFVLPLDVPVSPDVVAGNGVLFVLDGVLQLTRDKRWCLKPSGPPKQLRVPSRIQVDLMMIGDKGKMIVVGQIGYFDADITDTAGRALLFRLVKNQVPTPAEVIAASMGKQGGGPANPMVVLRVAAQGDDSNETIGGSTQRSPLKPPDPVDRVTQADLTGFYETVDLASVVRPFSVQINQAGKRIAGWINDVPAGFPDTLQTRAGEVKIARRPTVVAKKDKTVVPVELARNIVFAGVPIGPNIWSLIWWAPGELDHEPGLDPDRNPAYGQEDVERAVAGQGLLSLATGSAATDQSLVMVLRLDTPTGPYGPWTIVRVRMEARWPNQLIEDLPKFGFPTSPRVIHEAQDYLRATQSRPLPRVYHAFVRAIISVDNPGLMNPLRTWFKSHEMDPLSASMARDSLAAEIQKIFMFGDAGYKAVIRGAARAIGAVQFPNLDDGKRNLIGWFEWVVSEHWDALKANSANKDVADMDLYQNNIEEGFRDIGISPTGRFKYVLNFHQAHATFHYGIGFSPIAYTATVTREVRQANGSFEKDAAWGHGDFQGLALDMSIGLSGGADAGTGGALIGTADLASSIDLVPGDFLHAVVGQTGLIVGDLNVGPLNVFTASDVESMVVRLTNGVALSFDDMSKLDPKLDVKVSGDLMKKVKEKRKGWGAEVDWVEAHTVWTILLSMDELRARVPSPDVPPETTPLSRDVWRTTEILFDYNSSQLIDRDAIELKFAVDRYLFTVGNGTATSTGYASPEGNDDYNKALSLARARAMKIAVGDAFGKSLQVRAFTARGLGEEPARRAGLVNPPPKSPDEKARMKQEVQSEWWKWRKVELRVAGLLVARLLGRGAGAE